MRFLNYTAALLAVVALLGTRAALADPVRTDHVEAELVAENTSLQPGGENWVALRIVPEAGWHVYWRNPGDSGLPTSIQWTLPAGITAGAIVWPHPQRETLGNIVNYGYTEQTLLLVPLEIGGDAGSPVDLKAKAKWLVCKDLCIPGSAELSLSLPLASTGAVSADERWREAFASARARLPQPAPADWKVGFDIVNTAKTKEFTLGIRGVNITSAGNVSFFPYANDLINHSSPSRKANDAKQGLRITRTLNEFFVKAPEQVDGVLVLHDGDTDKAWEIHAQPAEIEPVPASAAEAEAPVETAPPAADAPALGLVLLFALLGGLILNLMPCVFPVLSIKAISLVESRGATARKQRAHALAYTAGVLLTFAGLAGLLLILRSTGSAIGWGFQLQQPAFVGALAYLFFAMGLSLSGVVEFGTRLMGVGQSLAGSAGYRGSFFTGVLAVAVASPCTAPFMGTALGYALSQPAYVAMAVFLALGFGLALPFLVIGFNPALGRLLPRPGQWMETFKQVMAFPLYLTTLWLLWVLGGLTDRNGMSVALLGCVLIAFALWLWNRSGAFATMLKIVSIAAAVGLLGSPLLKTASGPAATTANAAFEPWSEERLAALRAEGRTVFVNFTADWCITCKVNEHGALASAAVRQAFADRNVVWLEGDWTRADPVITKTLTGFGRAGVPLYLVYVNGGEPAVLPQVLTPDLIIAALQGAAASGSAAPAASGASSK